MKRLLIAMTLACVLSGTALAGDMPGVNHSTATGDIPIVGTTGGVTEVTAPVAGDMPGVTTVLLTIIITLLGR